MPAKAVAVVGFKNSGKTRVVTALTAELTKRGYEVGTIKHTADDVALDTPGKDTSRHREAGSTSTAILQENQTAIFLDQRLTLQQAAAKLGTLDYLVVEGFKTLNTHARILVPRDNFELDQLRNDLEIAIVNLPESKFHKDTEIPQLDIAQIEELADIVENKAFPLLPGIDCHSCGYPDCNIMGAALIAHEADISQCVGYNSTFNLTVNGTNVPLGDFTRNALQNVILGFIKTLKGGDGAKKVELEFEEE